MLVLRRPELADRVLIEAMLEEFADSASAMDGFWFSRDDFDYDEWLETCQRAEQGLGLPDGAVPYIQYVSFDERHQPIGFVNLRLRLNEKLLEKGGHIGYSIRPSQRRRGMAKCQLGLALKECLAKQVRRVLVTCHKDNEASRRTILAHGGVLEDVRQETERYWIDLEETDEQSETTGVEE